MEDRVEDCTSGADEASLAVGCNTSGAGEEGLADNCVSSGGDGDKAGPEAGHVEDRGSAGEGKAGLVDGCSTSSADRQAWQTTASSNEGKAVLEAGCTSNSGSPGEVPQAAWQDQLA